MCIIYPQLVQRHPDMLLYLPDLSGEGQVRYPERDFFYRVLNALHPDTYEQLISQAS